jgi:hypothetical protein
VIAIVKNAMTLISWAGVETGLKMLLTGIFEFESPIPQSFANAATGAHAITTIVNHQRCTSAYKIVRSSRDSGRRRGGAVANLSQVKSVPQNVFYD